MLGDAKTCSVQPPITPTEGSSRHHSCGLTRPAVATAVKLCYTEGTDIVTHGDDVMDSKRDTNVLFLKCFLRGRVTKEKHLQGTRINKMLDKEFLVDLGDKCS